MLKVTLVGIGFICTEKCQNMRIYMHETTAKYAPKMPKYALFFIEQSTQKIIENTCPSSHSGIRYFSKFSGVKRILL
jgi:hypothetical protein